MNNSIVFVKGITGFVGQNLTPYLAKDFDMFCILRKKSIWVNLYHFF